MACLSYLQCHVTEGPCKFGSLVTDRIASSPFVWYAAQSFDHHISKTRQLSDELNGKISAFLEEEDWFLAAVLQLGSVRAISCHPNIPNTQADVGQYDVMATLSTVVYSIEL